MLLQPNPSYAPTSRSVTASPATTDWVIVAHDGTTYSTRALMLADGKRPYPGLTNGGRISSCLIKSIAANGTAGDGVLYKRDPVGGVAPTTVADADQAVGNAGQTYSVQCPFREIWIKQITAGNLTEFEGRY